MQESSVSGSALLKKLTRSNCYTITILAITVKAFTHRIGYNQLALYCFMFGYFVFSYPAFLYRINSHARFF